MHRKTPEGVERNIRERIFPPDWFHPTYEGGADWEERLARVETAAARIARVVVHPDYRSEGFGALLVEMALAWARERGAPEGRRAKHLVYTIAQMARYHPFFERVGFRYLFDTASGQFWPTPSRRRPRPTWSASARKTPTPGPTGGGFSAPATAGWRGLKRPSAWKGCARATGAFWT